MLRFVATIITMNSLHQPGRFFTVRILCLAVLLFSQYVVAIHALEHPFHHSQNGCEIFQGVQGLDNATFDQGTPSKPVYTRSDSIASSPTASGLTAVRVVLIRAPPSVS